MENGLENKLLKTSPKTLCLQTSSIYYIASKDIKQLSLQTKYRDLCMTAR